MRINIDRLCELAGVPGARRSRGGLIREAAYDEYDSSLDEENEMPGELADALAEQDGFDLGSALDEQGEIPDELAAALGESDAVGGESDVIEVDEKDLVAELRRMRVHMHEKRKIQKRRQQNLQESQLKAIIDQEVKNVIKELNLNSGWVYGNKKPSRSRKGYTHQGSYLKGIGFR